jgi:hypothetical protein
MTEPEKFEALLKKTLPVSKEELTRRMEAEKASKQASPRVASEKG